MEKLVKKYSKIIFKMIIPKVYRIYDRAKTTTSSCFCEIYDHMGGKGVISVMNSSKSS
jgi:hypothetical protein